tara:strand:+ start:875 stop:1123 length:249 start_codon:yes stop_codon:yes gene_type:complete
MNKYIIYVKEKCPFCVKAIERLKNDNISFEKMAFDNRPAALQELKKIYEWQTVPMVFEKVGNSTYKLIGGYTDLLVRLDGKS